MVLSPQNPFEADLILQELPSAKEQGGSAPAVAGLTNPKPSPKSGPKFNPCSGPAKPWLFKLKPIWHWAHTKQPEKPNVVWESLQPP